MTPNEDQTGKEGYAVKVDGTTANKAVLVTGITNTPFGIIVDGDTTSGKSTVAVAGSFSGTVAAKLSASPGTVNAGTKLEITANGTLKASGTSTARNIAVALESGSANEMIEAAVIFDPVANS
jgi:hypothetical protein